ncbi:MAG: hypothetical protein SCALA702_32120 [Melioribacteraceae bacterium]|nr:MAG: hypothetical protein SCALA702_32120 [Melioribacteraceae bacterium]
MDWIYSEQSPKPAPQSNKTKDVVEKEKVSTKPKREGRSSEKIEKNNRPPKKTERKPRPRKIEPEVPVEKWEVSKFPVEQIEGKTRFHDLKLPDEIMHALSDLDFKYCTSIQEEVLPHTISGKDAVGQAQTGTGKTAAFLITIFNKLLNDGKKAKIPKSSPRALVVAPTRELAIQISKDAELLGKYLDLSVVVAYGGMDYKKQITRLKDGYVDLLIATPGRLIDFRQNNVVKLNMIEVLVLDEADRMLDMGFIPDVRKIVRFCPPKEKRQTLFFTATLNMTVERLAFSWTNDAVTVRIEPENVAAESVDQKVYITTGSEKIKLLYNIYTKLNLSKVMIFTNRKDEARKVAEELFKLGIEAKMISGDVDQKKRIKTLQQFKDGELNVLVATDVASRGLHIDGISHVINYSLPDDPEDYVHRIGRTGRAGASGISVSFASEFDSFNIPAIEKYIGQKFTYEDPTEDLLEELPAQSREMPKSQPQNRPGSGKRRGRPSGNRRNQGPRRHSDSRTPNQKRPPRKRNNPGEEKGRPNKPDSE